MLETPRTTPPKHYRGVVIPMVTPFTAAGALDQRGVEQVIDHLLAGGVEGIFVLGTTGEETSIPPRMRAALVELTVQHVAGRALVYAGISDTSLAVSIEAAHTYRRLGADVLVARLPSYFALTDAEQQAYFFGLLRQIDAPLMLYNITATTHMTIAPAVVEALSTDPRVVGIKDSDRDLPRLTAFVQRFGGRADFSIFVGATALSADALLGGVDGSVPGSGNLAPELCHQLYDHAIRGDVVAAHAAQEQLQQLATIINSGRTLPQTFGAMKAALGALDLCGPDVLPPLSTLDAVSQRHIQQQFLAWRNTHGLGD